MLEDVRYSFTTRTATEAFRDLRVLSENVVELEVVEAELRKLVHSSAVTKFQLPPESEIFPGSFSADDLYSQQRLLDHEDQNHTTEESSVCLENSLPWIGDADEDARNGELSRVSLFYLVSNIVFVLYLDLAKTLILTSNCTERFSS